MDYQISRMSVMGRTHPLTSLYSSCAQVQRGEPYEIELMRSRSMEPNPMWDLGFSSRVQDSRTIQMAALGRPLHLGRLYDCRNDSYITGVTLWDEAELKEKLRKTPMPNTNVHFSNSDSIRKKASLMNVNASLKASFLGGLVEVGGSAKYLSDQKSSTSQSRITMQYLQTTRYEELTMTHLSKITYPQVFEDGNATHVVTGVLYGAQAFMVFDKMTSEKEDSKSVEGALEAMLKKMFSVEGRASVNLSNEEKNLAENISCTFYGDYEIEENPTTFAEALQLYKKLPSLLKQDDSKAVPLKVSLYPLASLDSKAAKLEKTVREDLLNKVEDALEELTAVDIRCQDLLKNQTVNDFLDVKERLQTFQELFSDYKALLKKKLRGLLPAIRSGEEDDQELINILKIHQTSPFRPKNLKKWLDNIEIEVDQLHDYTSELSSITSTVISPERFNSILSKSMVDTVICFSFTSLKDEDQFLSSLPTIFDDLENLPPDPKTPNDHVDGIRWFNNPEIIKRMNKNILLFKNFCEANKDKTNTTFVIATIPDPSNPGTSIRLYQNCDMVDGSFQPVSKPPLPVVDILDKKVVLKLQKPPTGVTVKFRVEYKASHSDAEAWEFKDTPDAQESFTLTDLEMAHQYWVRYRAVSDVGMSEASDAVPFSIKGTVNIKVGQAWNWKTSTLFNDVRTKIMTSLGISRWNLSTIDSEVTNRLSNISIPYAGTIPGGMRPGMAIYYQGVVDPKATEFVMDQQSGEDIAFHFKLDIKYNSVLCNSYRNKYWESPHYPNKGCPLSPGSAFDMFLVIKKEGYEVYINGEKFCKFEHRIPVEKVTTSIIYGNVFINTMGTVNNWSTSTFGKEQSQENSRGRNSKIQFGEAYPVCSPSKPFTGPIAGGLKAGRALFFQGVIPTDSKNFSINLLVQNSDDIAFHFSPRFETSSVVRDSRQGGWWTKKEESYGSPFVKGSAFDIFMVVKPENYKVIVNGHFYCEFPHRIPVENVRDLNITGEVFMNSFGICEVDSVKISVTMPAHKGN